MNICVFAASSDAIDPAFFAAARELGTALARRGDTLVFGGCKVGLMGAVATAMHASGGRVVGIIPRFIRDKGLAYGSADELVVTDTMRERKARMEARADAFVALPGGFGTLEEMLEIITLKQLQQHTKAVLFLDVEGFYSPLHALYEHMFYERFAKASYRGLYEFVPTVRDALRYLDAYQPPTIEGKWAEKIQAEGTVG
jgi:uncharacterized protein (TIGR00730 family)